MHLTKLFHHRRLICRASQTTVRSTKADSSLTGQLPDQEPTITASSGFVEIWPAHFVAPFHLLKSRTIILPSPPVKPFFASRDAFFYRRLVRVPSSNCIWSSLWHVTFLMVYPAINQPAGHSSITPAEYEHTLACPPSKKCRPYPRARIIRALSRCQSRSLMASRLSSFFLPRPRPISSLAMPRSLK